MAWLQKRAHSIRSAGLGIFLGIVAGCCAVAEPSGAEVADRSSLSTHLDAIRDVVRNEIQSGHIPGAVVVVGIGGRVVFREAFGARALVPARVPMTVDTIFDIASLTKVVATTTAIMQLVEGHRLQLDRPVAEYWPAFGANGKADISVRDLLTHYSGLPADLPSTPEWSGYGTAMQMIADIKPAVAPGKTFAYSDVDFAVLGELVRRASGLALDQYCTRYIFRPLGMADTGFQPPNTARDRIAPADIEEGELRWGRVQDPMASRMGGVAGHAGLFSTADDLVRFAQMLLAGGRVRGHSILRTDSVVTMTTPQSPLGQAALRGLGWDIDSPYSGNLAPSFSPRSYGHTGYTGTALWVDPETRNFLVVLSNRLHPDGRGSTAALLRHLAQLVGAPAVDNPRRVLTGIDVLEAYGFRSLVGRRVGLVTNRSGRDVAGRRTSDVLHAAPGVHLVALFSPEHGLDAAQNQDVPSTVDPATGLPVFSLYGAVRRPTDAMLNGLDALVFDVQDAGTRFYTYATTMGYAMEAAARHGLDFFVLDRPNPITATAVQGPMLDSDQVSFVSYMPMPVRHGMTIGELAQMFNATNRLGAKLHVVTMRRYRRPLWYDETGLDWVPPSPNLRGIEQTILYPGIAMTEGADVSVGRGTDLPFEVVGAPWIDGSKLAMYLASHAIPGVQFSVADFVPSEPPFTGERCHGVRIELFDRNSLNSPQLGIEIISALYRLFSDHFDIDHTLPMVGSRETLEAIKAGKDPAAIVQDWDGALRQFLDKRDGYLLY